MYIQKTRDIQAKKETRKKTHDVHQHIFTPPRSTSRVDKGRLDGHRALRPPSYKKKLYRREKRTVETSARAGAKVDDALEKSC
jgi:hypothetical protein